MLFVDSEPVEGALIKGYSARWDLCELCGVFWLRAQELDALIYVDRVPTDSNPSDGLSRNDFGVAKSCGWFLLKEAQLPRGVTDILGY